MTDPLISKSQAIEALKAVTQRPKNAASFSCEAWMNIAIKEISSLAALPAIPLDQPLGVHTEVFYEGECYLCKIWFGTNQNRKPLPVHDKFVLDVAALPVLVIPVPTPRQSVCALCRRTKTADPTSKYFVSFPDEEFDHDWDGCMQGSGIAL